MDSDIHEKPAKYKKRNWRTRLSGSDSSNSSFNADFLWPNFFYNSLRFTCPHLCCAESLPHHRTDCPILLNRLSGNRRFFAEGKLLKKRLCSFTTGYGQNETLSCLIDCDLQRSGRVKALPFGCYAALTRPDPADMIQTSKQSLSVVRIPPPPATFSGYCLSN